MINLTLINYGRAAEICRARIKNSRNAPVRICLLMALLAFQLPSTTEAQRVAVLDNGLTVIVKENHTAPVSAVRIYVNTGSIHEGEYSGTGISHVFEHLINGGTTSNYSESEITALIEQLGGANNAYTTRGHTCYFIKTSNDQVNLAIDVLADWMKNSSFPQAEFDREIGVVLEELNKGKDEPGRILHSQLYDTMFSTHPAKFPVIGYENLVRSLTRDDILRYYERMYVPNNITVVAVGDFSEEDVLTRIKSAFRDFERRATAPVLLPDEPKQLGRRTRTIHKKGLGSAYFNVAFHTVPIHHEDLFALDVLSYILSHGRSSRLIKNIQEDQRLVSSIYSYSDTPKYDAGIFLIGGTCGDENTEAVIHQIQLQLDKLKTKPVLKSELSKAIQQKIADDILSRQTADSEAANLGINMITTGNPGFDTIYLSQIREVTAADIMRVARTYFTDDNTTIALLRPETSVSEGPEKSLTESATKIIKEEFPNGLRLLVKRNPNVPLVNIQAYFLGGVLFEPPEKAGISHVTAEMLTRGTSSRSKDDIASRIDSLGGRLSSSSGNNTLSVSLEVLRDDFPVALEIFSDLIQNSIIPGEELEIVKQNTLSRIDKRRDRWDSEISYLFRKYYFGSHPYARDQLGTRTTVEKLDATAVKEFYKSFVIPSRCVVSVFGDIDIKQTVEAVGTSFRDFSRTAAALPEINAIDARVEDSVIRETVNKNLSAVYIGYPGIRVDNTEDRFPLALLDTIISGYGYPGGRLHKHLRGGNRDLVYYVHAFNFMGLAPGYFGVLTASSPEKTDEVIDIVLKDIDVIRTSKVSDGELAKAKIIYNTMEKLSRQTNSSMSLQAAIDELYGLGYDFADTLESRIEAVSADDVQRVAKKYLTSYVLLRTEPPTEVQ